MPIELALPLTVALGGFGMRAPVGLLIVGVLGPPLLPAVDDHLGIHRVGLNLLPVVISAATTLALRLAANALLESVRGKGESFAGNMGSDGSAAMRLLRNRKRFQPLSKTDSNV